MISVVNRLTVLTGEKSCKVTAVQTQEECYCKSFLAALIGCATSVRFKLKKLSEARNLVDKVSKAPVRFEK